MSFWDNDHPTHQDKYDILYKKYVPGVGKCYEDEAEAIRLVSGVGYQLMNNGCWYGTDNYNVKEYISQGIRSPADYLMQELDRTYNDEDFEDRQSFNNKCETIDNCLVDVVNWTWNQLAVDSDKKELVKRERKNAKRTEKEEETFSLQERLTDILPKDSPLVNVTELSPEMAKFAEFMSPDPVYNAEKNTFTVSEMEFREYQTWQGWGRGPIPPWFHTDDEKASEIMNKYDELHAYYCN